MIARSERPCEMETGASCKEVQVHALTKKIVMVALKIQSFTKTKLIIIIIIKS